MSKAIQEIKLSGKIEIFNSFCDYTVELFVFFNRIYMVNKVYTNNILIFHQENKEEMEKEILAKFSSRLSKDHNYKLNLKYNKRLKLNNDVNKIVKMECHIEQPREARFKRVVFKTVSPFFDDIYDYCEFQSNYDLTDDLIVEEYKERYMKSIEKRIEEVYNKIAEDIFDKNGIDLLNNFTEKEVKIKKEQLYMLKQLENF